jgi:hypothetical protein
MAASCHEAHEEIPFVAANWHLRHFLVQLDRRAGCEGRIAATTGPVRFAFLAANELVRHHSAPILRGHGTDTIR